MMPVLWSDVGGDPVPANVSALHTVDRVYRDISTNASEIARELRTLLRGVQHTTWNGSSADAFRARSATLPPLVDKVARSYEDASLAVRQFAGEVEELTARRAALEPAIAAAVDELRVARQPVECAAAADPIAIDRVQRAIAALGLIQADCDALRNDYLLAETRCKNAISIARHEAIPPLSYWQQTLRAVESIVQVVGVVVAIVAVVAVIAVAWPMIAAGASIASALATAIATTSALTAFSTTLGVIHVAASLADRIWIDDDLSPKGGAIFAETALLIAPFALGRLVPRSFAASASRLRVVTTAQRNATSLFSVETRQWTRTLVALPASVPSSRIDAATLPFTVFTAWQNTPGRDSLKFGGLLPSQHPLIQLLINDARTVTPTKVSVGPQNELTRPSSGGFTDHFVPLGAAPTRARTRLRFAPQ